MSPSVPGSNKLWFGISMVLVGLVVGYGVSVGIGGISIGGPAQPDDIYTTLAVDAGLNKKTFKKCMGNTDQILTQVKAQMDEGAAAGISGTPGNILINNATNQAILVSGAQPLQNFKDALATLRSGEIPEDMPLAENVTPVDPANDHIRGPKDAPYSLIEYSDFECPYCQRHWPTVQQLIADESDVNWVYRHFPLSFHAHAQQAAIASECAAQQGKFWEYGDVIAEKGFE
jgi:protein-disulfide isomerase